MPRNSKSRASRNSYRFNKLQRSAIKYLAEGYSVGATICLTSLSAVSLWQWILSEPEFMAEVHRRIEDRAIRMRRQEIQKAILTATKKRLNAQDFQLVEQVLDDWVSELP